MRTIKYKLLLLLCSMRTELLVSVLENVGEVVKAENNSRRVDGYMDHRRCQGSSKGSAEPT